MENLDIYNKFQHVPEEAKRAIQAGRLKGKTDINPMWRIHALTSQFGPCGIGWRYEITRKWLEPGANNEVAAFVDIALYIRLSDAWSEAIPGTGGASFIASERGGLYTSDECFKMALTDALSVACKALGVGADVYWEQGSKYTQPPREAAVTSAPAPTAADPRVKEYADAVKALGLTKEARKTIVDKLVNEGHITTNMYTKWSDSEWSAVLDTFGRMLDARGTQTTAV